MLAHAFTRDDCKLRTRRISYAALQREYRCGRCGGRLGLKWDGGSFTPPHDAEPRTTDDWHVECGRCGSIDFIHERELARQKYEAAEVLAGLPPELAAKLR